MERIAPAPWFLVRGFDHAGTIPATDALGGARMARVGLMVEETRDATSANDDPLVRIAARRIVRKIKAEAQTPQFGRLLILQAAGAAGDALLALALAGTLFFSVPTADARGKIVLYLLLTMAPFAIVGPLMARFLDRHK